MLMQVPSVEDASAVPSASMENAGVAPAASMHHGSSATDLEASLV